eukprot:gene20853-20777_t
MTDINSRIDNEVKSNDVVLFMKGTPDMPMCGFSGRSVQILQHVGVPFKGINVLDSAELRQGIKDYTNWPTIPQLYVKGEFVGGSDILMEMFQSGELKQLFTEKGVASTKTRAILALTAAMLVWGCSAVFMRTLALALSHENSLAMRYMVLTVINIAGL